ncbi:MAG: anion transporter, partial [Phototrophicales bacterium]
MNDILLQGATLIIVLLTYAAIAIGRVPHLRMNRATIALVGAASLIAIGALSEDEAFAAIDIGTILLLAAMMVINVNLRLAGFFDVIGRQVLSIAQGPQMLLAIIILMSGILSAIFLNDTICLMFTPLVIDVTKQLKR